MTKRKELLLKLFIESQRLQGPFQYPEQHYFGAACVFKNNQLYRIPEWIAYYKVVGATRIILVNTEPDNSAAADICSRYDKDLVYLHHAPGHPISCSSYSYPFFTNLGRELSIRWLAYIDNDEYILPRKKDTIPEVLKEYDIGMWTPTSDSCVDSYQSLAVNWCMFGSSGVIERPKYWTQSMVHRAADNWDEAHRHVKCIAKPAQVIGYQGPHNILTSCPILNENGKVVTGPFSEFTSDNLRINHYVVGSWNDFQVDMASVPFKNEAYWRWFDRNEVFDDEIWKRFGNKIVEFDESVNN